jgi:hypothetical protein
MAIDRRRFSTRLASSETRSTGPQVSTIDLTKLHLTASAQIAG